MTFGAGAGGASVSVFTNSTSPLAVFRFPIAEYMIPAIAAMRMTPSGTPMPMEAEVVSLVIVGGLTDRQR